ncbi:MAG TPA: S-methyl-5'-thioadenosine phosphorylase [Elusimicrobiales bacterium]|jgi:5'-methylthioadenosine phosphorylase|nr:S-methyl-5'-thioadenosine phosphorylase [Elusimicrobiales bacterium]HOL61764.1 S-methyl-5'-thioadenosine phosphorylase [Elusimicrobiales bacterium]HPO94640.1 S-methyl-5'-thioadenosine phosphorylase [Elusimicrobiales bacterium]
MKLKAEIGVIGGSGLYNIEELKNKKELNIRTPFGKTSDKLMYGEISGVSVIFVPRHGRGHTILPTDIPHQANMWALKSLGVKTVISVSAVGSLKEELAPSHFVFPDQFVDETKLRKSTFFGEGVVAHVPMAHPFCMDYSRFMFDKAKELGIKSHFGGVYVCMEGPQFSTKAESEYHRRQGYSVIGMTVATECKVAKEAGLHYTPVSLVTDYDCWKEEDEVSQDKVLETLHKNVENIKKLLVLVIPEISKIQPKCHCENVMKTSLLTSRDKISKQALSKLKLIIG